MANVRGEHESFLRHEEKFWGRLFTLDGRQRLCFGQPRRQGLNWRDVTQPDVAETTATVVSGSESSLPDNGLRVYRRTVKAARPVAAASVVLRQGWKPVGQRQPAGSVHDSLIRQGDAQGEGEGEGK